MPVDANDATGSNSSDAALDAGLGSDTAFAPRALRKLPETESLRLLASVPFGRVVFSQRALPAIRPVNHIVDGGEVMIRTHLGAAVMEAAGEGVVVAYEADGIDPVTRLGWSVTAVGMARVLADPVRARRYAAMLRPWVAGAMDCVIAISPQTVTGYRLVDGGGGEAQAD